MNYIKARLGEASTKVAVAAFLGGPVTLFIMGQIDWRGLLAAAFVALGGIIAPDKKK